MINLFNDIDLQLEKDYMDQSSEDHRKKYAQFFTPAYIAEIMVSWLLGNENLHSILEPAFGLGVFSRLLIKNKPNLQITGFEIDDLIYSKAIKYFENNNNITIKLLDYLYNEWNIKYDGIICNPPYFKFHDYDNKNIIKEIESKITIRLNGSTNLYTLFLLKSLSQLNYLGRAAYIVPSEFLNSDYGRIIKQYLLDSGLLKFIFIIDFKKNVFNEALTTSSILLFANDNITKNINILNISNLNELESLYDHIIQYPESLGKNSFTENSLDACIKWRNYYQNVNSLKYKNLIPFSNFGKVVRGIATGDNTYFVFNKSKAEKYRISDLNLIPCISKSSDIKNIFFKQENFKSLVDDDKNMFLFDGIKNKNVYADYYIKKGELENVNQKYLTSKRNPWYSIEQRQPSPILISVFHRNKIKFIRNYTSVRNLTTFHCIYLNLFSSLKEDLLFAYLLTDIAHELLNDNRREYGNGLKKFEPNDINSSLIPDLNILSESDEKSIVSLLSSLQDFSIDCEIKSNLIINKINNIFRDLFTS